MSAFKVSSLLSVKKHITFTVVLNPVQLYSAQEKGYSTGFLIMFTLWKAVWRHRQETSEIVVGILQIQVFVDTIITVYEAHVFWQVCLPNMVSDLNSPFISIHIQYQHLLFIGENQHPSLNLLTSIVPNLWSNVICGHVVFKLLEIILRRHGWAQTKGIWLRPQLSLKNITS